MAERNRREHQEDPMSETIIYRVRLRVDENPGLGNGHAEARDYFVSASGEDDAEDKAQALCERENADAHEVLDPEPCKYSARHAMNGVAAVTIINCGPVVGMIPACRKCADFYATLDTGL
jgi:hypothetical protein